jgi:hypothetical protein
VKWLAVLGASVVVGLVVCWFALVGYLAFQIVGALVAVLNGVAL